MSKQEQVLEIAEIDKPIALLGRVVWKLGPLTRLALAIIRVGKRGSVPEKIEILM